MPALAPSWCEGFFYQYVPQISEIHPNIAAFRKRPFTLIHILGIRHHGVGSARHLKQRLHEIRPDVVLVEGPPEFDAILHWVQPGDMEPPVAILGYNATQPEQATFYPFAQYSPEWQAIMYANTHRIPVAMLDLPLQMTFEMTANGTFGQTGGGDPLGALAAIEGFGNSQEWWEHRFEQHRSDMDSAAWFEAVMLAITTLRTADLESSLDTENQWREAWMRKIIRETRQKMFAEIVVVCGAWHAPALLELDKSEKSDQNLLKKLPKSNIQISATWVPWTNERLGIQSGYGAGVSTPGWSEHRWTYPDNTGVTWLSEVAQKFRAKKIDISTAHVIEALRLSETLAAMRQQSAPRLEEYNEATATVMCMGDQIQLEWLRRELVIGHKMGVVPDKLPKLPIQADFEQQIKQLRLKLSEEEKEMELDLREARELEKSILLHRLSAMQIRWGQVSAPDGAKGTFREVWLLQWRPELELDIITRGTWGNTIEDAANNWLTQRANAARQIGDLTELLEHALPGALYTVIGHILVRLNDVAARSSDIYELMTAVPPFARAMRYGNVRNTDQAAIEHLLDGIVGRICVGLPTAGYGIDDDTARQYFELMAKIQDALLNIERPEWLNAWYTALQQLQPNSHPVMQGYATRLLLDTQRLTPDRTAQLFSQALSRGNSSAHAAAWLEGFLRGSGSILLYDNVLWNLLYQWTATLPEEDFNLMLPILRRTFSGYEPSERRRIGEKAKRGPQAHSDTLAPVAESGEGEHNFDTAAARAAAVQVAQLLWNS